MKVRKKIISFPAGPPVQRASKAPFPIQYNTLFTQATSRSD